MLVIGNLMRKRVRIIFQLYFAVPLSRLDARELCFEELYNVLFELVVITILKNVFSQFKLSTDIFLNVPYLPNMNLPIILVTYSLYVH